jgi:tetratricopeptide (TPR) repeat protein
MQTKKGSCFSSFQKAIFIIFFSFLRSVSFSQDPKVIDSLEFIIQKGINDTNKVHAIHALCWEYIEIANYPKALTIAEQGQKLAQSINYKKGEARAYNNIGVIYYYKSDYPKTLDYYFKALKIFEEIGEKRGIAVQTGNIGMVYADLGEYKKALETLQRSLQMNSLLKREFGMAKNYSHIGLLYHSQDLDEKALENYNVALKMFEKLGNEKEAAVTTNNIANIYYEKGEFKRSLEYYKNAVLTFEKLNSLQDIALNYGNMGAIYMELKNYSQAEQYLLKALTMADSLGLVYSSQDGNLNLSKLYEITGKPVKALQHYKDFITNRDSIYNEENTKKLVRTEMNFEFEKTQAVAKAEQEKKDSLIREEQQRERVVRNSLITGFALVLLLAFAIYKGYRNKQKANIIITEQKKAVEKQKEIIEEKQKEILDSIHYAKKIQQALLPTEKYIRKTFERIRNKS